MKYVFTKLINKVALNAFDYKCEYLTTSKANHGISDDFVYIEGSVEWFNVNLWSV